MFAGFCVILLSLVPMLNAMSPTINITLKENDSILLNCTDCKGPWKFSPSNQDSSPAPSETTGVTGGMYEVRNVQYSKGGYYSCNNECLYFIDVQIPPRRDDSAPTEFWCSVLPSASDRCADPIYHLCPISGNPKPTVTNWTLLLSPLQKMHLSGCLTSGGLISSDKDIYDNVYHCYYSLGSEPPVASLTCMASNSLGSATVNVTVIAEMVQSGIIDPNRLVDKMQRVESGTKAVNLSCEADAPHNTQISWSKDGIKIQDCSESHYCVLPRTFPNLHSVDTSVDPRILRTTLQISGVKPSDEGNYTCQYSFKSTTHNASIQLEVFEDFPVWAIVVPAVGGVVIVAIISIVVAFVVRHRTQQNRKKERDEIQKYFRHEFYVSCSLSASAWKNEGKIQMSKNSSSFFEKVLKPSLEQTESKWHNTHSLNKTEETRGFSLGDPIDEVSSEALHNSWKIVILVDEDEEEIDNLTWQQSEIETFKACLAPLIAGKAKIQPLFIVVRLGNNEGRKTLGLDSYTPFEVNAKNFGSDLSASLQEMKEAILRAKETARGDSEFIWDVTIFGCLNDEDEACVFKLRDIIKRLKPRLSCEPLTYSAHKLQLHGVDSRRVAAYSRVVIAVVSEEYLEHFWEHQKWMVEEGKLYVPVIRNGLSLPSIPEKLKNEITCIWENDDHFESRLVRGITVGKSRNRSRPSFYRRQDV
eukprot:m.64076 g.64076  ORF g.64076 m.64076 type:complete len:699 (+) comp35216_c0_seq3:83-2179(+)